MCHWVHWRMECIWRKVHPVWVQPLASILGQGVGVESRVSPFRPGTLQGSVFPFHVGLPKAGPRPHLQTLLTQGCVSPLSQAPALRVPAGWRKGQGRGDAHPASMVYSRMPRLQMSQPSS